MGSPGAASCPCSQKEQTVGEGNRIWTSIFQWINQTENLSHPFAVQVLQALRPLGPPGADESRLPALALNRPRQGRLLLKYICPASTPCHQTPDPCRHSASPQSSWKSHRTKKIHPELDQELPGPNCVFSRSLEKIQQKQISRNTLFLCSLLDSATSHSRRDTR